MVPLYIDGPLGGPWPSYTKVGRFAAHFQYLVSIGNLVNLPSERIIFPNALYGAETWRPSLKEREEKRLRDMEIKFLRSMCGVTMVIRISIEELRRRVEMRGDLSGRMDK